MLIIEIHSVEPFFLYVSYFLSDDDLLEINQ